ncbi:MULTISPECIES: GFA family protein [Cobetia]|uniref:GFA family protein n=1 Tax=Cobetia crustatorum TaxID=553385 RepID=A0A558HEG0_9GAMM|nr:MULTISPECIES: GFA family protein [Cobetia]TVU67519.1 GFA family protein [Cobetia crustatorum]
MFLEGACHCRAVSFSLESPHPYPYQRCYCSICRKLNGGGGYAINISGEAESLQVEGDEHKGIYHPLIEGQPTIGERHFCRECGTSLWVFDSRWPALVHLYASAIDTPLPRAPEHVHIMLDSKADWVTPDIQENDQCFAQYPEESIAAWHSRLGLQQT